MKLHLPTNLFRAVLACCAAAVSFSSSSWAVNTGEDITYDNKSRTSNGGALYSAAGTINLRDYGSVTFSGNYLTSYYCNGGAIYAGSGILNIADNGDISFTQNRAAPNYNSSDYNAASCDYYSNGGAIYTISGTLNLTDNGNIDFTKNHASSSASSSTTSARGGAIYVGNGTLNIRGNGDVSFSENYTSADSFYGYSSAGAGAIYVENGRLDLSGNGHVSFSGNYTTTWGSSIHGGAIYLGQKSILSIKGNASVTFRNNYEEDDNSCRLRSIYSLFNTVELCAEEGQHITFYDSVYVIAANQGDVSFNKAYEDADGVTHHGLGDIVFSGKYVEVDLKNRNKNYTQQELTNSLTSEVYYTMTNLYGGRLRVEDGAIYKGYGITAEVDSAATVRLQGGTLDHAGYALTFNAGTTLEAQGVNSITATSLDLLDGSALTFTLGETNLTTAAVTLTGTFNQGGALTINLADDGSMEATKKYALLTMASGSRPASWDKTKVTVNGLDAATSDLSWSKGTLYLTAPLPELTTATWTGAQSMVWDTTAKNWTQDGITYAYKDGVDVIFGDTGAGTVTLAGNLAPNSVLVDSSSNYTWSGDGSLTGDMTLTKSGTGSLTISTANTYTGGTILNAGTLVAGNASAFGTGDIRFIGGVLDLDGYALANAVAAVNADAVIESGTLQGEFNVTGGSLNANGVRIASQDVEVTGAEDVSFCNSAATYNGGAICGSLGSIINLSHNENVIFDSNSISSSEGGAIYSQGGNVMGEILDITWNSALTFSENSSNTWGGAISTYTTATINITNNGNVLFSENQSKFGGAICVYSYKELNLTGNTRLEFNGNHASEGGAIYSTGGIINLASNGDAIFIANSGAAIYGLSGNTINIVDNGHVEFRGNYEQNEDNSSSTYRLRSVYTTGSTLNLAAGENQDIVFYDSLYANSNLLIVAFNPDYKDVDGVTQKGAGDILFSGKYVKEDLKALKANYTQQELTDSLTSEVYAMTHLYGGRLRIEDGAIYKGNGITAEVDSAATVRLQGGTLDHAGYALTFNAGTTLEAQGGNSITASSLDMLDGSALTFTLGEANLTTAAVTLTGTFNQGSALTINLADDGTMAQGNEYALLTMTAGTTPESWDPTKVTVNGLDASLNSLKWQNGTLYLGYAPELVTATWTGAESMVWDTTTKNWTQDGYKFAYKDGVDVIFGDTGAGTVTLAGALAPKSVLVDSSGNYTWSGGGKLTGDMTLTKSGTGSLTISTANTYTGGTILNAGTLVAGSATAFGTGAIQINEGALDMGGYTVSNSLHVNGDATISNGACIMRDNFIMTTGSMRTNGFRLEAPAIKISGEKLEGSGGSGARGGSMRGTIEISDTELVSFHDNSAFDKGGAICAEGTHYINLTNVGKLIFQSNTVNGLSGGAIQLGNPGDSVSGIISGNDEVIFYSNSVVGSDSRGLCGGAICATAYAKLRIEGNGRVDFISNYLSSTLTTITDATNGGAIYGGIAASIKIVGNGEVVFRGNYEKRANEYMLRSIFEDANNGIFELAAGEGDNITFYDTIFSRSSIAMNRDFGLGDGPTEHATGDIVFSGKFAAEDLKALKADYTQQELTDSLTSEVYAMTHLYGGHLRVEDGAIYKGNGITAEVDSAATVRLQGGTLDHAGYALTFNAGTTLEAQGGNSITASSLDMLDGSALTFTLGEANLTTAAVTLTGTFNQGGALTINLADDGTMAKGNEYALLTMTAGATPESWDPTKVTVNGLDASLNSLKWQDGTLYLGYALELVTATWSGSESMVWDTTAKNWTQDGYKFAYKDGVDAIFGDTGAGTVTLAGTLAPKSVLVDSTSDYTWSGSGKLTGDMVLTKSGTGSLTISTANTYTGGTAINGGKVVAMHATALGTGVVTLSDGTLEISANGFANGISASGTSALRVADGYTLALSQMLANSGILTVSGTVNASALTLDTTAATHINVNDQSGASGFAKSAYYSVQVVNGGTVGGNDAVITHINLPGTETLVLGTDGYATAGGVVDYSNYLLTGSDSASTAAIHAKSAGAAVTQTGGTLTVDDTVTVATTAGTISLAGGTLNGTVSGATINAASGALNAALTGSNTLNGTNYALQSVVNNGGTLTMSGSFNASALTLDTTAATHVDVAGNLGASGFAKDAIYSVKVANGTTVNSSATIMHGTHNLVLGTDGVAKVGGDIDYSNYLLTGSDTASTTAIHAKGSSATVTQQGGTLTVNDTVTVTTTAGVIALDGGALNGTITNATINATSGALNAALSGSNTLTGTNYALQSVVNNSGALTLKGSLDLSKLSMSTSGETHVDVEGREGSSGFTKASSYSITLVSGGTVSNDGVALSRGGLDWTLQPNGVATAGGGIDHAVYYLTGTDTASTKAIHAKGAGATVTQTGGTLTVDDTVSVTTTAGVIALAGGTLNGSVQGATINAANGALNAALTGSNTLAGTNYALQSVVNNSGTLTMSGSFNAAALQLDTTAATHIDVNDQSGASGFAKDAIYSVTVANGTTVNSSATIMHGTHNLVLGTDGVAKVGGTIDYSNYLLTGSDTASTATIHAKGASATVTQTGGTLTVDDTVTLATTAGTISLENGGIANGSIANADVAATGGRVNASISGRGSVTSNGDVTLSGANSYTGMTTVNGGPLTSTALVSDITLNGGTLKVTAQTLGSGQDLVFNGGSFQGDLTTGNGSSITLAKAGGITGNLTLGGGSIAMSGKEIAVSGTLTLSSQTILDISSYHTEGEYGIATYGKLAGDLSLLKLPVDTQQDTRLNYSLKDTGTALKLTIDGKSLTLTWKGGSGEWKTLGDQEWQLPAGVSAADPRFHADDSVVFSNGGTVTINGEVKPASVTVNGPQNVSFVGTGSIVGAGALAKLGDGTLTMNATNSYSGGTSIQAGIVKAGGAQSFGGGEIALSGGTLNLGGYAVANAIHATGGSIQAAAYAGTVTVAGNVTLGSGTVLHSLVLDSGSITGGSLSNTAVTAHGGSISSAITGSSSVTTDGSVTLSGTNTYTGITQVRGGTLTLGGSITSDIEVKGGTLSVGTLALSGGQDLSLAGGNVSGSVSVGSESVLSVDSAATISSGLTLAGGTLALSGNSLGVGGTLNIASTTTLSLTGYTREGNYTLATYGSLSGDLKDLVIPADVTSSSRLNYSLANTGTALKLTIDGKALTLTWKGGSGEWKTLGDQEWQLPGDVAAADPRFHTDDSVVYTNGGTVAITGEVKPGSVTVGGTQDVTFGGSGRIVGAASLAKQGSGTLTMNATNSYSGGTSIGAGLVKAGGAQSFGSGDITLTGGTLQLGSHAVANDISATGGSLAATAYSGVLTVNGSITLGNGTTARSIVLNNGSITGGSIAGAPVTAHAGSISSAITGTSSVTTDGTVSLNGDNSYNGRTTVIGGTLTAGSLKAFGDSTVALASGTLNLGGYGVSNNILTTGGTLSGASTYNGTLTVDGNTTLAGSTRADGISMKSGELSGGSISNTAITATGGTIASNIAGTSSVTSNGDVTLSGTNSYTGTTTVNGGTLTSTALVSDITLNGGMLKVTSQTLDSGQDLVFNGGSFQGNLTTGNGSGITLVQAGTVAGGLTLNGGSLTFNGNKLSTTGALTLAGSTTLNVGNLAKGSYTLLSFGSLSGSTDQLTISGLSARYYLTSTASNLILNVLGEGQQEIIFPSDGGGATWEEGSYGFQDGDDVVFDNTGEVVINGEVKPGTITVTGDGEVIFTGDGSIGGNATLIKDGEGTLIMNDGNTYSGGTIINGGTVIAGGDTSFGTGDITLNDGTLDLDHYHVDNDINAYGGELDDADNYEGDLTVYGDLTLGGETTANSITINGGSITGGSITDTDITAHGGTINSIITGDTTLTSDGNVTINGDNSYTGGTTVNGGTLTAGSDTAFGTGDITLNDGTLDLDHHHVDNDINAYGGELDDADNYEGDLTVYGNLTLGGETTANSITINSGSISGGSITDTDIIAHGGTINSTITGDTTLTSDGNVTINGDNSYTGGTTVNGGTLTAGSDTAFGTGDITLNGGTLNTGSGISLMNGQDLVLNGGNVKGNVINGTGAGIILNKPGHINGTLSMDGGVITTNGNMLTVDTLDIASGGTIIPGSVTVGTSLIITANHVEGDLDRVTIDGVENESVLTATENGILLSILTDDPSRVIFDGSMHTWQNGVDGYDDGDYVTFDNAGSVTIKGYVAPRSMDVIGTGNTTWNGSGSVAGNGMLTKDGSGTLTINTSNSFTGGTVIKQGTVSAGANNALGTGAVTMKEGSTLKLNGKDQGQNDVTVTGAATLAAGSGGQVKSLTVSTKGGAQGGNGELLFGEKLALSGTLKTGELTLTKGDIEGGSITVTDAATVKQGYIDSNISGNTLEKTGNTRVELKGSNSFSDGVIVSGGQLALLEGGSLTGDVTVKQGGALLTAITVNGNITLENGADMHLRPETAYNLQRGLSSSGGMLHGSLATAGGASITLSGAGITVTEDATLSGGSISYNGSAKLKVNGTLTLKNNTTATGNWATGSTYTIVQANSLSTGGKNLNSFFNLAAESYTLSNTGSSITLTKKANVSKAMVRMATGTTPAMIADDSGIIMVGGAPEAQPTETAVAGVADAMVQADWGVVDAERAFGNAVRGAHGNLRALGNGKSAVWANAYGSMTRQSSAHGHAGADRDLTGAALGFETMAGEHGVAGIGIGHSWSRVNTFGMSRLKQDAQHAGVYGRARVHAFSNNSLWIEGSATYGKTESRGQLGYSRERWTQNSGSISMRVNDVQQLNDDTSLNFFGGLEYLATDNGSIEDVKTGSEQNLRGEIGAGIQHAVGKGVVFAQAALQGDMVRHNPQANLGVSRHGANPGRIGGSITVGGAYSLGEHWSVNAAYTFEGVKHNNSHNANVGATFRF